VKRPSPLDFLYLVIVAVCAFVFNERIIKVKAECNFHFERVKTLETRVQSLETSWEKVRADK
jgi:hypothetical protein